MNITAMVNETGNYTNIAEVTAANDSTPNNNTAGVAVPPPSIKVSINQIQTDCSTTPGKTEVKAFVTVVDQIGDPVTTLTKNQVTVSENNDKLTPDQFDMKFVNAIPLSVAIVLDYSTSIFDSGADIAMKDAAIAFINQLSAIDRAAIIKFGLSVQVIQPFTSDKDALRDAVRSPFVPERGTEIYKAILKGLEVTAEEDSGNRKAVAIITDGRQYPNPSTSGLTIDDVLFAAEADSIPIFPIGLGSRIDTEVLATLALESGGIFYQSIVSEDLREIYQQLADALIINQFVFTYTSDLTGGVNLTIGADYNGLTDSDTRQFTTCP